MSNQDKSPQQGGQLNKQAGGPQVAPQGMVGPGDAESAGRKQQAGSAHQPQRFSQQVAQKIPSDPDPDDPVSP